MALLQQLNEELKKALRSRDEATTGTLRLLLAALHGREKDKQAAGQPPDLTDAETIEVLQKEAKKRKESAALFLSGNRADLASKEQAELAIIERYLPAAATTAELQAAIAAAIAGGAKDFPGVMKEVMAAFKGRCDGKEVGELIRAELSKSS